MLSEVARGAAGDVAYPMPWAATATTSFLSTPDDTRRELGSAGFEVEQVKGPAARGRFRGAVASPGRTWRKAALSGQRIDPRRHRGYDVANVARVYKDGCLVPIEVVVWKR